MRRSTTVPGHPPARCSAPIRTSISAPVSPPLRPVLGVTFGVTLGAGLLILALAAPAVAAPAVSPAAADPPTAEELLARSIAYHDPDGVWGERVIQIVVRSELSKKLAAERGSSGSVRRAVIDPLRGSFALSFERDGSLVEVSGRGDDLTVRVDGKADPSPAELERVGMTPPRARVLRNYLTYLYGLPMKLRDAGTRLDPTPRRTTFAGRDVWALRVTYDPSVGTDTWYFYLDPETAALVGYRFFHDEAKGDGEYVVLSGEAEDGGLRLPKVRRWYTNPDDTYLATDTLDELHVFKP